MNEPKEEAERLYHKFQEYLWRESDGYYPDHTETVKTVNKVIDEIENVESFSGDYWVKVRKELNNIPS